MPRTHAKTIPTGIMENVHVSGSAIVRRINVTNACPNDHKGTTYQLPKAWPFLKPPPYRLHLRQSSEDPGVTDLKLTYRLTTWQATSND